MEFELFIIEVIGLIAQALFILGFFLLEKDKIEEDSRIYNVINIVAAILAVIYYAYFYAYAGIVGNVIWGVIAIYGLTRGLFKKKNKNI